jgi:Domain of unknown function (DUF6268)
MKRQATTPCSLGFALWFALGFAGALFAQSPPSYPSPPSGPTAWGGYAVSDPVPYQPSLEVSCQTPLPPGAEVLAPGAVLPGSPLPPGTAMAQSEPWQIYPVPSPANTPVVTIPAPGDIAFPQPGVSPNVSPSGLRPWFPPGGRQTFFQKVKFTGDYLPRFGDEGLGITDGELDVVFALPFLTVETPLLITPFYAVHFLDGPVSPDVPPRLHDAAITFQNIRPINDHWLAMFDVTVGQYADDASFDSSEATRVTGGGAGVYRSSDQWKWVLGATYVDRIHTKILPIAGFVYTPNDDYEYNLVFPVPKISRRLPWSDAPGRDERWAYVGGEFGGGKWAVRQADGTTDRLDITDWRVFLGYERRIIGGLSRNVELGYVFLRKLEYQDVGDEIDLSDTLMVRGGLTY